MRWISPFSWSAAVGVEVEERKFQLCAFGAMAGVGVAEAAAAGVVAWVALDVGSGGLEYAKTQNDRMPKANPAMDRIVKTSVTNPGVLVGCAMSASGFFNRARYIVS